MSVCNHGFLKAILTERKYWHTDYSAITIRGYHMPIRIFKKLYVLGIICGNEFTLNVLESYGEKDCKIRFWIHIFHEVTSTKSLKIEEKFGWSNFMICRTKILKSWRNFHCVTCKNDSRSSFTWTFRLLFKYLCKVYQLKMLKVRIKWFFSKHS